MTNIQLINRFYIKKAIIALLLTISCNVSEKKSESIVDDSIIKSPSEKQQSLEVSSYETKELIANRFVNINVDLEVGDLPERLDDGCDQANLIRLETLAYLRSQDLSQFSIDEFIKDITMNASSDCPFPRDNLELKMLYVFAQKLLSVADNSQTAITLIFNLRRHFTDVVEFSQYIQFVIPQVAIINTTGFVHELSTHDTDVQKAIIEDLQYIDNQNAMTRLIINLSKIKSHPVTVNMIQSYINDGV